MYKSILFLVGLQLVFITVTGQKNIFLRVYDTAMHRLTKGHFVAITDSSLKINNGNNEEEINYKRIGIIKTLHSKGHNMAMAGVVGAVAGGVVGALSGEPKRNDGTIGGAISDIFSYTPAEGFVMGFFTGAVVGAPVGLLFNKPKQRKVYAVNGNLQSWLQVSNEMNAAYKPLQP